MAVVDNALGDRFGAIRDPGRETLTVRLPGDVARAIRIWQAQHLYLTGEQVSRSDALEYLIWRGLRAAEPVGATRPRQQEAKPLWA